MSYDVFISYRRESGSAEARLIQAALVARGKRCFLDVTDLHRGYFDETLLEHVAQTPNFILILSPGALDRCQEPQDWLRLEINQALLTGSTIVPVILPGFRFPATLPEEIRELPRHQGVDYSHRYFDAMMAEITGGLGGPRTHKRQYMPPPPSAPTITQFPTYPPGTGTPGVPMLMPVPVLTHKPRRWLRRTLIGITVLIYAAAGTVAWATAADCDWDRAGYFAIREGLLWPLSAADYLVNGGTPEGYSRRFCRPAQTVTDESGSGVWPDAIRSHFSRVGIQWGGTVAYEPPDKKRDGYVGQAMIRFHDESKSDMAAEVYSDDALAAGRFKAILDYVGESKEIHGVTRNDFDTQFVCYQTKAENRSQATLWCMGQYPGRPWVFFSSMAAGTDPAKLESIYVEALVRWMGTNGGFPGAK